VTISPAPPRATLALPWDDPDATDPVGALTRARAELGDTFDIVSGRDRYLFLFSPDALRVLYALPEPDASKGIADYRMLVRKLPEELFSGVRTLAHDLFGAQDVETYLGHLDHALALELAELGDAGTIDAFGFARRIGHRLGLACWIGDNAAESPWFERFVVELDRLDGADAFVHPDRMLAVASDSKAEERAALARVESMVGELLAAGAADGFLREIARRWDDTEEPERTQGIARDVVLLHVATMTNLFAALGWTLALLALHPKVLDRVRTADPNYLERCALEAIRIGQCSSARSCATSRSTTATRATTSSAVSHSRRCSRSRTRHPCPVSPTTILIAGTGGASARKRTSRRAKPSRRSGSDRTAARRSASRCPRSRVSSGGSPRATT
jgi:cytochrome P450